MTVPLSPEQLAQLRHELEAERRRLEGWVERAEAAGRPVELDQTSVGRLSRMDALQNQGLAAGAEGRARRELTLVNNAIARIDDDTYGRCQTCGRMIPAERLLVMPETPYCGACGRGE